MKLLLLLLIPLLSLAQTQIDLTQQVKGALPTANGGTGTDIGGFTNGSLIFKTTGALAENSTNLFWDDTNKRLGVGINSPTDVVTIQNVDTTDALLALDGLIAGEGWTGNHIEVKEDGTISFKIQGDVMTFGQFGTSSSGNINLTNADPICWRDSGDSADFCMELSSGDVFEFTADISRTAGLPSAVAYEDENNLFNMTSGTQDFEVRLGPTVSAEFFSVSRNDGSSILHIDGADGRLFYAPITSSGEFEIRRSNRTSSSWIIFPFHPEGAPKFIAASDAEIVWDTTTSTDGTGEDVGIVRDAAGRLRVTDGSTGRGDLKIKDLILEDADPKISLTDTSTPETWEIDVLGSDNIQISQSGSGVRELEIQAGTAGIIVPGLNNEVRFASKFSSLQAAIDDAEGAGGGVVIVDADTSISSTLTIQEDNVNLKCWSPTGGTMMDGGSPATATISANVTITWTGAADGTMIDVQHASNNVIRNVWIEGCALDANTTNNAATALDIEALTGGGLRNVSVTNCLNDTAEGCIEIASGTVSPSNVNNAVFENIECRQDSLATGPCILAERRGSTNDMNQTTWENVQTNYYGDAGFRCDACDNNLFVRYRGVKLGGSGKGFLVPSTADICGHNVFYGFSGTYENNCNVGGGDDDDIIFGMLNDSDPESVITVTNLGKVWLYDEDSNGIFTLFEEQGRLGMVDYPEQLARVYDECMGGDEETGEYCDLGWDFSAGTAPVYTHVGGRPGQVRLNSSASSGTVQKFFLNGRSNPAATWIFTYFLVPRHTTDVLYRVGLANDLTADPPADGIYYEFDAAADTNWQFITRASSTETQTDTGVTFSVAEFKLRAWRKDGSNVCFSIDDATETCQTTNIPTALLNPFIQVKTTTTAEKQLDFDYFEWQEEVSRP